MLAAAAAAPGFWDWSLNPPLVLVVLLALLYFVGGRRTVTPARTQGSRRWRGALLSHRAQVTFDILESDKRPVSAVADNVEVRGVIRVDVKEDRSISLSMLFDAGRSLDERMLAEQFSV